MSDSITVHNTFVIRRTYPTTPARVFAALADPAKKRQWFAEGASHDLEEFELDFRVGGVERVRSRLNERTPFPGVPMVSEGTIHDIVPDHRVVIAATMSVGERRISSALATFEIVPVDDGTELVFTHQAAFYEGADGPEMREGGWRAILDRLGSELAG